MQNGIIFIKNDFKFFFCFNLYIISNKIVIIHQILSSLVKNIMLVIIPRHKEFIMLLLLFFELIILIKKEKKNKINDADKLFLYSLWKASDE